MPIISIDVCSNCRRPAPSECDGVVYRAAGRLVCRGRVGADLFERDCKMFLRVVMGHGTSYTVEAERVA